MDQPPPGNTPSIPAPPPQIDLKLLWTSLLLPPGICFLCVLGFWVVAKTSSIGSSDSLLAVVLLIVIGIFAGWAIFVRCIKVRFRHTSLVLLVLAFPLLQSIVTATIFFFGCLAIIATG